MSGAKRLTTDQADFARVFEQAQVAHLALCDDGAPYIVPLCFGKQGDTLYFHTGLTGKKLDILRENPAAGFELEADVCLRGVGADPACASTMDFISVVGTGRVEIVSDGKERLDAMGIIMRKYTHQPDGFVYRPESFARTVILRLTIENMSCKKHSI